jgi:hypothetical protein
VLVGWCSLLFFAGMGLFLESLHGFKSAWYVGVDVETRRTMWTLAHTHGTLISAIQILFGLTAARLSSSTESLQAWGSTCLLGALLLMPLGFFLGGLFHHSGDPGIGILLVPPGGLLLLLGIGLAARCAERDFQPK